MMPTNPQQWLLLVGALILGAFAVTVISRLMRQNVLSRARREAAQTISDAEREAATIAKEAKTTLREQEIDLRQRVEQEAQRQHAEVLDLEKRIVTKEESLERRLDTLDSKTEALNSLEKELEKRGAKLQEAQKHADEIVEEQLRMLETVSGMTADAAREVLYEKLENQVRRDTARRLKRVEDELVETVEKRAKKVLSEAIQRCASDHVAEHSISVVALPSEEMKGRIIGREGRNIRALETATGINIIIDDTPEAVVLSGFDPIRREIARITLERLITDGRIHPARIEEMVEKVSKEMEQNIREWGDEACLEVDVHGLHPEVVKLLGRLKYRTSYGQNVLRHSQEVCHLTGIMAAEIGEDINVAKRAGLIHDMGKALTHEVEGSHALLAYDLCKKYGETELVANAVGSHHNEMPQNSVIAVLVQAADALSAARPGARRETVDTYIKRIKQLEEIADAFPGVEKSFAIQAGREVRIVVRPEDIDDAQAQQLARDIARKVENDVTYPGQIKVTVVRETRAVDTAK
ncbi:MAG: ribonuclease Y [Candidatus Hydrogenedentes bacterium]|nr:ribonuclease Y [Candidatus Hydrogenedentota bacterium]